MATFVEDVTKSVGADNGACMNGNPVAKLSLAIQDNVGEKTDVVAKLAVRAEVIATHKDGASSQAHASSHDAIRSDVGGRVNCC